MAVRNFGSMTGIAGSIALLAFWLPLLSTGAQPQKTLQKPSSGTPAATPVMGDADEAPLNFDPRPTNLQQSETGQVLSVAFSPDGKTLATVSGMGGDRPAIDRPGELRLWNAATHRQLIAL